MGKGVDIEFVVIGWDHHKTAVDIRERLAFSDTEAENMVAQFCELSAVSEAVVLSTCNRTECYIVGNAVEAACFQALSECRSIPVTSLQQQSYCLSQADAVRHIMRVASSLESMVLGEYQIVHQLKNAWALSSKSGYAARHLDRLFHAALTVGKHVRNDTAIGKHKSSVASIGVDLAKQIHGDLAGKRLLVVGAGEMAELAVTHLIEQGVSELTVLNRSQERARQLAIHHVEHITIDTREWSELESCMEEHDILITSTAAPVPVIKADAVRRAVHKRATPLLIIDLAVPRDAESSITDVDNAFLFNIDHLDTIVSRNQSLREEDVSAAEKIVETAVQRFMKQADNELKDLIKAIISQHTATAQAEAQALIHKMDVSGAEAEAVNYACKRLANKLANPLLDMVKKYADHAQVREIMAESYQE